MKTYFSEAEAAAVDLAGRTSGVGDEPLAWLVAPVLGQRRDR